MDRISLRGIEVFAHHGVLAHERELGQAFTIDVDLDLDLASAAETDELTDTVDYGALAGAVARVAASGPYDLIESVAGRILDVCLQDPRVHAAEVTVHKPHAPLPVVAEEVAVTLRRTRS